jgi:hypothetical protein
VSVEGTALEPPGVVFGAFSTIRYPGLPAFNADVEISWRLQ